MELEREKGFLLSPEWSASRGARVGATGRIGLYYLIGWNLDGKMIWK